MYFLGVIVCFMVSWLTICIAEAALLGTVNSASRDSSTDRQKPQGGAAGRGKQTQS